MFADQFLKEVEFTNANFQFYSYGAYVVIKSGKFDWNSYEYLCNTSLFQNTSDHYKVSCYPRHEFEAPKRSEEGTIECVASEKYGVSF